MNRILKYLALFFESNPHRRALISADIKRDKWADAQARNRAASPREMRELLAACKDDYVRAERCLVAWDLLVKMMQPAHAWRSIMESVRKGLL